VRPEIGTSAIESAEMPNGTRAILGSERLLLETIFFRQAPGVRELPGAKHLTERGTVIRTNESGVHEIWHAAKMAPFKVKVGEDEESVTEVADVSSEGVVLGKVDGDSGYSVILPVTFDIVHIEKQRDENGNETEKVVMPGAGKLLRDEIAELHIRIPPLADANYQLADWELEIDLDTEAMKMQTLDSRGPVQMYDLGTVDEQTGVVTPLSINPASGGNPAITKAGPYDITLPASNDGLAVLRIVLNKEGTVQLSLKDTAGMVDVLSEEIEVVKRIRKYALVPEELDNDYQIHDQSFELAASYWGDFYEHNVDPDILKAIGYRESQLGYQANESIDIMSVGNVGDHVLDYFHREPNYDILKEAYPDPAGLNGFSIRFLHYSDAAESPAQVAIHWGVCWLYQKAQKGQHVLELTNPPFGTKFAGWNSWETAVSYFGPNQSYINDVEPLWKMGFNLEAAVKLYFWPVLTNARARK
jgi:hypothetical protein